MTMRLGRVSPRNVSGVNRASVRAAIDGAQQGAAFVGAVQQAVGALRHLPALGRARQGPVVDRDPPDHESAVHMLVNAGIVDGRGPVAVDGHMRQAGDMGRAVAHQGAVDVVVEQTGHAFRSLARPALGQVIDPVLGPQRPDLEPAFKAVGAVGLGAVAGDNLADGDMVAERLQLTLDPGQAIFDVGHGGSPVTGLHHPTSDADD
jgi:hypothetical protein